MKIAHLEIENVKRVKAVALEPAENGLTVIGGANGQGKTSVLDAIAWALGGEKYRPSAAQREGSVLPPHLRVTLDNGIVVERSGVKSALKVTDPSGKKAGQRLLDTFVSSLALDLPRFLSATDRERAEILLQVMGIGSGLREIDRDIEEVYVERRAVGRLADGKKKYAEGLPYAEGYPDEPISPADLLAQQQEIIDYETRRTLAAERKETARLRMAQLYGMLQDLSRQVDEARAVYEALPDPDPPLPDGAQRSAALAEQLEEVDAANARIRANAEKRAAEREAEKLSEQYDGLTVRLEKLRRERQKLLASKPLPLPGLSVDEEGKLTYNGRHWDCMSGSEQLRTAVAIVRREKPGCGFVLVDKLEQMDLGTLRDFGAWLEGEGLQAIATRVSTGRDGECTLLIEDGCVAPEPAAAWQKGVF